MVLSKKLFRVLPNIYWEPIFTNSVSDLKSIRMNGKIQETKILKDKEASLEENNSKERKRFCKQAGG